MISANGHQNQYQNQAMDSSRVRSRRVSGNLLRFGRRLRSAGMPVGSGHILGLIEAIEMVGIQRRDDVYSAARATLVSRPEQLPLFNAEFLRFWADLVDQQAPMFSEAIQEDEETVGMPNPNQRKEKGEQGQGAKGGEVDKTVLAVEGTEDIQDLGETEEYEIPPEDVLIFSAGEALRKKDSRSFRRTSWPKLGA